MILNTQNTPQQMSFDLVESPWLRAGIRYNALDLFTGEVTPIVRTYRANYVAPHGSITLLLTNVRNRVAMLDDLVRRSMAIIASSSERDMVAEVHEGAFVKISVYPVAWSYHVIKVREI